MNSLRLLILAIAMALLIGYSEATFGEILRIFTGGSSSSNSVSSGGRAPSVASIFSGASSSNTRSRFPVELDTSDGRFERFNGPVQGLPQGHGGGRFGAADCLLCPEGQ